MINNVREKDKKSQKKDIWDKENNLLRMKIKKDKSMSHLVKIKIFE